MTDEQIKSLRKASELLCAMGYHSDTEIINALLSDSKGEAVAWEYRNLHGNPFLTHDNPAKWHPNTLAGFKDIRPLAYLAAPQASEAVVDDLRTLVTRLAHSLRKAAPDNDLPGKALDYLRRKGIAPSPLREAENRCEQAGCAPSTLGRTVADAKAYVDTWDNQRRSQAGLPSVAPRTDVEKDAALPDNINWTSVMKFAEKHGEGWSEAKGWSFHCDDDLFNFAGAILAAKEGS